MTDRHSTSKRSESRSSIRSSIPNVFSDDYVLEEYEPVADGRPPTSDQAGSASMTLAPSPQRSASVRQALDSPRGSIRRSRLSQRSVGQGSTMSRYEDESSRHSVIGLARTVSSQHRSIRTISSLGVPRVQSPYQGPTGPSQPYGMYSQDVSLGRSPSVTTTSTIRPPERAYSGPGGPTQPYAMYSQNTVPEDDQEVAGMAPPVPGFAGVAQPQPQVIRRLGPDGEDADDLIGPDGYTEQLPPYSRYANGIPPKHDSGAATFINQPPQLGPQGTQDMAQSRVVEHYTEPSEYYRPEAREIVPASPGVTNPFDDSSAVSTPTTAANSTPTLEKSCFKERVRRKGNKRVCCGLLPCWALGFMIVVLCAAVLLGGVIGGIVAHHTSQKHYVHQPPQPQDNPVMTTTTTLADASPITVTPTNLPTLPTGAFSYILKDSVTDQNLNSCLPASQSSAWDCATSATLNIGVTMQGPQQPLLTIGYTMTPNSQNPNPLNTQIRYGAQPPTLPGPMNMKLMRDNREGNLGPAYSFQQPYTKTVIVKAEDLPGNSPRSKRSAQDWSLIEERGQSEWTQNQFVSIADKPWYCYWNSTLLEVFIYVTQNESSPDASSYPSPTTTTMASQRKRQAGQPSSGTRYPRVIKLEERRPLRAPPQPYCQKMQILNNGQPAPYEPHGEPIIFNLTETEPAPLQQQQLGQNRGPAAPPPASYNRKRQIMPNSACMCEWQN